MKKILLMFGMVFFISSCQDNMSYMEADMMNDAQLIEAIANDSNKIEIDNVDLPVLSRLVVETQYFDHIAIEVELSPNYGYQLSLGDMAVDAGDVTEVFFAKDGRKLGDRAGDDRKRHGKRKCFRFVFPLSFSFSDGSSYTVADHKEFYDALKAQYEATGTKEKPAFTFPIQVQFKPEEEGEEGEILTVNSDEELKEAFQACRGEENDKRCFSFVFPVSFTMPDGSTLSASDEEDLATKMRAFFESYDGEKKKPELVFPADITFEDGSVLTVNSHEEMKQAWKDNCRRKGGEEDEGESDGTRG